MDALYELPCILYNFMNTFLSINCVKIKKSQNRKLKQLKQKTETVETEN